jgi:hypothetical protein
MKHGERMFRQKRREPGAERALRSRNRFVSRRRRLRETIIVEALRERRVRDRRVRGDRR